MTTIRDWLRILTSILVGLLLAYVLALVAATVDWFADLNPHTVSGAVYIVVVAVISLLLGALTAQRWLARPVALTIVVVPLLWLGVVGVLTRGRDFQSLLLLGVIVPACALGSLIQQRYERARRDRLTAGAAAPPPRTPPESRRETPR